MSKERFVDSLFTGTAVVPAALTLAGHFDIAFLVFCPLLIGACLTAVYLENHPGQRTVARPLSRNLRYRREAAVVDER
jgi:hypothetical protein